MTRPIRLTAVLTHPIQYYAPWFRHIEAHAPELALTVVHAIEPTPEQQGVGYGRAFAWDVPLTDGYRSRTVRPARPDDSVDAARFFGLDVREIGDAVLETDPDVVLVPGWYSITLLRAIRACRRRRIPILYRGDSNLLSGPVGWRRAAWIVKTRLLLRQFDGHLSTGTRSREFLRRFGVPAHRVFDVAPAVDNDLFTAAAAPHQTVAGRCEARRRLGLAPDAFVPVFVGRLTESKRPLDAVRALAKLERPASLLVAGAGPLEERVRAEAVRLGVDARLIGFRNQTELGEVYASGDCLVLPASSAETWGLVVNEALATGLPCVVSDAVGCAPDLVLPDRTGFVHPCGDVDALAAALEAVARRKADGRSFDRACRERAAEFSFDVVTAQLVRACRSVLRRSPAVRDDAADVPQRIVAWCGHMVFAGGLERMTFRVLQSLTARGMRAHCIVNGWENFRITPLADAAGVTWSVGPYWYPLTRRRLTPLKLARMAWEVMRVSANFAGEARRLDATHVLLPEFLAVLRTLPALWWLRLRGTTIVLRLGNAPDRGPFYETLWRWAVAPSVDAVVCNSAFTYRELADTGVSMTKMRIIVNTVAPRQSAWGGGGPRVPGRVVFVGQIIPGKGVHLLLDAIAILRSRGVDATLDVVGDMDGWEAPACAGYRASLRERAAACDLAGAVDFLGSREDVPDILARASVHCCPSLPSIREGFGNVVLEAKLSSLPSVVFRTGDLPDLVAHRETGWVCSDATAPALADGLQYFLTDDAARAEAGRAALASATPYSAEAFEAAWSDVVALPAARHPIVARTPHAS